MGGQAWLQSTLLGIDPGFAGLYAFSTFVLGLAATNFSAVVLALALFEDELQLEIRDDDQDVYGDE